MCTWWLHYTTELLTSAYLWLHCRAELPTNVSLVATLHCWATYQCAPGGYTALLTNLPVYLRWLHCYTTLVSYLPLYLWWLFCTVEIPISDILWWLYCTAEPSNSLSLVVTPHRWATYQWSPGGYTALLSYLPVCCGGYIALLSYLVCARGEAGCGRRAPPRRVQHSLTPGIYKCTTTHYHSTPCR